MPIENCRLCVESRALASLRIKQHLDATTRLTQAIGKGVEITALCEAAKAAGLIRKQAVIDYKRHIVEHTRQGALTGRPFLAKPKLRQ